MKVRNPTRILVNRTRMRPDHMFRLQMHPTIPVHGDLTLSALVVLKSSPHWEEGMEKDWTKARARCVPSCESQSCEG